MCSMYFVLSAVLEAVKKIVITTTDKSNLVPSIMALSLNFIASLTANCIGNSRIIFSVVILLYGLKFQVFFTTYIKVHPYLRGSPSNGSLCESLLPILEVNFCSPY